MVSTLICFLLVFCSPKSKERTYDILFNGKKIGTYTIRLEENEEEYRYSTSSKIRAPILGSIEVVVEQQAVYRDGWLVSARSTTMVNQRRHQHTAIKRIGEEYKIESEGDIRRISGPIGYTLIRLFFEKPQNQTEVFSENDGRFHQLEYLGNARYRKTDPDGRKNIYKFSNGKVVEAEIDAGWYSFKMRLRH